MKTQELRIGNYLFVPGIDREVIVSAIFKSHYVCEDSDGIRFDESVSINYQPIPITEEWLLKLGFERDNRGNWRLKSGYHWIELYSYHVYINGQQVVLIDYVHQLQNIWFALTGKELTHGGNK